MTKPAIWHYVLCLVNVSKQPDYCEPDVSPNARFMIGCRLNPDRTPILTSRGTMGVCVGILKQRRLVMSMVHTMYPAEYTESNQKWLQHCWENPQKKPSNLGPRRLRIRNR